MPLPSFLQRKPDPHARRGAAPDDGAGPVEAARTRARRRLIGAVVLLAVGVVVFPLVFETQPRPLAVNVPIEVPARKDGGSVVANARPVAPRPAPPPAAEAPVEAPVPASAAAPEPKTEAKPEPKPEAKPEPKPDAKPAPAPVAAASKPAPKPTPAAKAAEPADRGERAKALLDGKPPAPAVTAASAKDGRFVVQVGAYTDADALREARQKVERLGLKTYTQVVETDAGKRTRVRIGPFATREDAERAAAKIKGAALPAAVLTL